MVLIIGHRGARDLWPENSLGGFRKTLEIGIDGVEFDVHLTRDGGLAVIHDPLLDRTTLGQGVVGERSLAELAATPLRGVEAEGVPALDQVLDLLGSGGLELHVELKTDHLGRPYPGMEAKVIEAVQRRGLEERAILTCFAPAVLETIRQLAPEQRVLASLDRRSAEMLGGLEPALDRFLAIPGCLLAIEKGLLPLLPEAARRRIAPAPGVWVPNERADLARWLGAPVRAVTTDRPDIALAVRRELAAG
jgi:glycerophosphoryl diester phosphodiesterase